jgi:hypothetical protein
MYEIMKSSMEGDQIAAELGKKQDGSFFITQTSHNGSKHQQT